MEGTIQPPVPKAELLERERRWSRPAGIAALFGVVLAVVSVALQQSAISSDSDTDAERLVNIHDNAGEFFLSNVLQGLAFLLFAAPLWFLFKAAQGRSDLVRTAFGILAIVGPALLLASQVISAVGFTDVADKFDKELPSLEREGREEARQEARQGGEAGGGGERTGTDAGATQTQAAEATETTETAASETEGTGTTSTATDTTSDEDDEDPEENTPKEDRAEDLVGDSSAVSIGGVLSLPGFLGFVVGMVYIPLWAMRTGLLTRFWGSLGMAIGVVVILIPPAQLALMLWMAAIGLMLIGIWPGSRPPAWEEGVAIPWLKPGESPPPPGGPGASGGTVEGSGRELSEPPLPEESPPDAPQDPDSPYEGESQGQRRKKRKRRS